MKCKDCKYYYTDEEYCTYFKKKFTPHSEACEIIEQGVFNERFYVKSIPLRISTGYYYILIDREDELKNNDAYFDFNYEDEADDLCIFLNKQHNRLLRLQKLYNENYYINKIEEEYKRTHDI